MMTAIDGAKPFGKSLGSY